MAVESQGSGMDFGARLVSRAKGCGTLFESKMLRKAIDNAVAGLNAGAPELSTQEELEVAKQTKSACEVAIAIVTKHAAQFAKARDQRLRLYAVYFEYGLILLQNMLTADHVQQKLWARDFTDLKRQAQLPMLSKFASLAGNTGNTWKPPSAIIAEAFDTKVLKRPFDECVQQYMATTQADLRTAAWNIERQILSGGSSDPLNAAIDDFFSHPTRPQPEEIVYSMVGVASSNKDASAASDTSGKVAAVGSSASDSSVGMPPLTDEIKERGRQLYQKFVEMGLAQWDASVWTAVCHCNHSETVDELAPRFIDSVLNGNFDPEMFVPRSNSAVVATTAASQTPAAEDEASKAKNQTDSGDVNVTRDAGATDKSVGARAAESACAMLLHQQMWRCMCSTFLGLPETESIKPMTVKQCEMCGIPQSQGVVSEQPLEHEAQRANAAQLQKLSQSLDAFLQYCLVLLEQRASAKDDVLKPLPVPTKCSMLNLTNQFSGFSSDWMYMKRKPGYSSKKCFMSAIDTTALEMAYRSVLSRNTTMDAHSNEKLQLEHIAVVTILRRQQLAKKKQKKKNAGKTKDGEFALAMIDLRNMNSALIANGMDVAGKPAPWVCRSCNTSNKPSSLKSVCSPLALGDEVIFQTVHGRIEKLDEASGLASIVVNIAEHPAIFAIANTPTLDRDGADASSSSGTVTIEDVPVAAVYKTADKTAVEAHFHSCMYCSKCRAPSATGIRELERISHSDVLGNLFDVLGSAVDPQRIKHLHALLSEFRSRADSITATVVTETTAAAPASGSGADATGHQVSCPTCSLIQSTKDAKECIVCGGTLPLPLASDYAPASTANASTTTAVEKQDPVTFQCSVCNAPSKDVICIMCGLPCNPLAVVFAAHRDNVGGAKSTAYGSSNQYSSSHYNNSYAGMNTNKDPNSAAAIRRRVEAQGPYIPRPQSTESLVASLNETIDKLMDNTLVFKCSGVKTANKNAKNTLLNAASGFAGGLAGSAAKISSDFGSLPTFNEPNSLSSILAHAEAMGRAHSEKQTARKEAPRGASDDGGRTKKAIKTASLDTALVGVTCVTCYGTLKLQSDGECDSCGTEEVPLYHCQACGEALCVECQHIDNEGNYDSLEIPFESGSFDAGFLSSGAEGLF